MMMRAAFHGYGGGIWGDFLQGGERQNAA